MQQLFFAQVTNNKFSRLTVFVYCNLSREPARSSITSLLQIIHSAMMLIHSACACALIFRIPLPVGLADQVPQWSNSKGSLTADSARALLRETFGATNVLAKTVYYKNYLLSQLDWNFESRATIFWPAQFLRLSFLLILSKDDMLRPDLWTGNSSSTLQRHENLRKF